MSVDFSIVFCSDPECPQIPVVFSIVFIDPVYLLRSLFLRTLGNNFFPDDFSIVFFFRPRVSADHAGRDAGGLGPRGRGRHRGGRRRNAGIKKGTQIFYTTFFSLRFIFCYLQRKWRRNVRGASLPGQRCPRCWIR